MRRRVLIAGIVVLIYLLAANVPIRPPIDREGYGRNPSLLMWLVEHIAPWMEGRYLASILKSNLPYTCTSGSGGGTCTITSVTVANSVVLLNGSNEGTTTVNLSFLAYSAVLTNATTVTVAAEGLSTNDTVQFVVSEFYGSVLTANGVQRGTTSLNNLTSATATITAVGTKAQPVACGVDETVTTPARALWTLVKTNSTTLTMTKVATDASLFNACWQIPDWK